MRINRSVRWTLLVLVLMASISSFAGVFVSVSFGPPAIPVYEQPLCPSPGYIWTPGYWAYGPNGYFWVPGTWVVAPQPGLLWTPGYWGWGNGAYFWHGGYWGPVVGFYGGINYGFGYTGYGYQGGYWRDRQFYYNRNVNNVNVTRVTNVYNTTVINNTNRTSYNGGAGGLAVRPTTVEERAAREKHFAPTTLQTRQETTAAGNRQLWASVNQGRPAIAATARPGVFKGNGVVAAKEAGAPYTPPVNRGGSKPVANNVPRPGNNSSRPAAADRGVVPTRNEVPRPTNNGSRQAMTPARNEVPRPSASKPSPTRAQNAPRPENTPRENMSRPNNVPRPEIADRNPTARPDVAPRASAPRPGVPRQENMSRPQAAPRGNEGRAQEPREGSNPKEHQ